MNSFEQIKATIPENVKLVAVSKTKPNEAILEVYNQGQRVFGENKVQELVDKYEALPKDIEWHLIGHLQTNKVKYVAPFVALIHAVDSLKLLQEINKQGLKNNRIISCLFQFHIADEETKFGFDQQQIDILLKSEAFAELQNIQINGVMGMATFTNNQQQIETEFQSLKQIFDGLKSTFFRDSKSFETISMGMSGDYQLAIKNGSNMVRIGSAIFGGR